MLPIIDLRKKIFIEADNFLNKLNEPNLLNIDYFDIMVCSDYDTLRRLLFFIEQKNNINNINNIKIKNIIIYHLLFINLNEENRYNILRENFKLNNIDLFDKIRIKLRKMFLK